jgi:hypothetical protein
MQIEMLDERLKTQVERADAEAARANATAERAQQLQRQVKEVSETLVASEELQQQKDALIEELRIAKHAKACFLTTQLVCSPRCPICMLAYVRTMQH